jgi:Family of unknown function (DUF6335)
MLGLKPTKKGYAMLDSHGRDTATEAGDDPLAGYLDETITENLEERPALDQVGRETLRRRLGDHPSEPRVLSTLDGDAAWDLSYSGDETVGVDGAAPDSDVVGEKGKAAGLTYSDAEPLNYAKVASRDQHRWELNPESVAQSEGEEAAEDEREEDQLDTEELDEVDLLDETDEEIDIEMTAVVELADGPDEDDDDDEEEDDDDDEDDDDEL